ncbi:MAG: hypothetical protein KF838_05415 [Phycisphaeraceae bacterium]|nr:MAG: hypothetical protein KF838_05415 [Phycisphaeraceae bacterium]
MAISGLVVTLAEDPVGVSALTALAADSRLTLGDRYGQRIALVAETPSARDDHDLFDQLRQRPGIVQVDVTFVHLDASPEYCDCAPQSQSAEDSHAHH